MSKADKESSFSFGMPCIVPSTQNAFEDDGFDGRKRKELRESEKKFAEQFSHIISNLKIPGAFPTDREVFVTIVQFFVSEEEYAKRDIDNISRTVMNNLKNSFIKDDGQVRTLLASKQVAKGRVKEDFVYISTSILKKDGTAPVMKDALQSAMTFYEGVYRASRQT